MCRGCLLFWVELTAAVFFFFSIDLLINYMSFYLFMVMAKGGAEVSSRARAGSLSLSTIFPTS